MTNLTPRERAGVLKRRLLRNPRIRDLQDVMAVAGDSGGSLLAAGLAFNALFATIPALLLVVGVVGFLMGEPAAARDVVLSIVARVPALADLVDTVLRQVQAQRTPFSVVGIVGVAWASTGFYGSLDAAMRRLFPGHRPRGVIQQRLRGLFAVLGLVLAVVASVIIHSVIALLDAAAFLPGGAETLRISGVVLTAAVFVVVVWLCYVLVPTDGPGWRVALAPALVVGLAIGALTALFGELAPLLVGSSAGIGLLAAIFGSLVWLRLVFQLVIYGGAWARIRRDRARRASLGA